MNRPNQPADDFDPDKTAPNLPPQMQQTPPEQADIGDLSATIIGPADPSKGKEIDFAADPNATRPQTEPSPEPEPAATVMADSSPDVGATIIGAVDDRDVTGSKELDAEDAAATQPGIPEPAALDATIVSAAPEDADPADVNSTQAWSPALVATQTPEHADKLLLEDNDDGSANTIPGKKSTPGPTAPAGSGNPSTPGSAPDDLHSRRNPGADRHSDRRRHPLPVAVSANPRGTSRSTPTWSMEISPGS